MADPYPEELKASAAAVAQLAGLSEWRVAYQSAGATPEPWLGPEAGALLTQLAAPGHPAFLIVPFRLVFDHVEILYGVHVKYPALAARLDVQPERTPAPNHQPPLLERLPGLP